MDNTAGSPFLFLFIYLSTNFYAACIMYIFIYLLIHIYQLGSLCILFIYAILQQFINPMYNSTLERKICAEFPSKLIYYVLYIIPRNNRYC